MSNGGASGAGADWRSGASSVNQVWASGPGGASSGASIAMRGADGTIHVIENGTSVVKLSPYVGEYQVPEGVSAIVVIVVGGGGGAGLTEHGGDGKVLQRCLSVKPGDRFRYEIGKGGGAGQDGGDSFFVPKEESPPPG